MKKEVLEQHVANVHDKARKFPCYMCDLKAATKSSLDRHIRVVHLNMRGFACALCDFRTSRREYLANHMHSIHGQLLENMVRSSDG